MLSRHVFETDEVGRCAEDSDLEARSILINQRLKGIKRHLRCFFSRSKCYIVVSTIERALRRTNVLLKDVLVLIDHLHSLRSFDDQFYFLATLTSERTQDSIK
jgi:hypothetical protein